MAQLELGFSLDWRLPAALVQALVPPTACKMQVNLDSISKLSQADIVRMTKRDSQMQHMCQDI